MQPAAEIVSVCASLSTRPATCLWAGRKLHSSSCARVQALWQGKWAAGQLSWWRQQSHAIISCRPAPSQDADAIPSCGAGGKRTVVVPPSEGFGDNGVTLKPTEHVPDKQGAALHAAYRMNSVGVCPELESLISELQCRRGATCSDSDL